jgi:hypothetical protein
MEKCFAGSDSGANTQTLSIVGNIVEAVVMVDYLQYRTANGGFPIVFDAPAATDFFDLKGDKCDQFARFIKLKNGHVDQALIEEFCRQRKVRDGDKGMVPDIITHDGALREFYEVKPSSSSGRSAGVQKIRNFCELSAGHGLPYCVDTGEEPTSTPRGSAYNPNYRRVFWRGQHHSIPAQVSLRFERDSDSLILYRFCVEVTPDVVNETILILFVKAAIVALILTRGAAIGVLAPAAAGYLLFMRSPLLGGVGFQGENQGADAKYIQRLLNAWRAPRGLPLLAVDGAVGTNTINAISAFQEAETPAWVDGLVEPGRNTIKRLEELYLTSINDGFDPAVINDDERREWLDDVAYATALLTPGNQDPPPAPGDIDPLPIEPNAVVLDELQQLLDLLHDADFGPNQ